MEASDGLHIKFSSLSTLQQDAAGLSVDSVFLVFLVLIIVDIVTLDI